MAKKIVQQLDQLPAEIRAAERYFSVFHNKVPRKKEWNNPAAQRKMDEVTPVGPVGFDISSHGIEGRPDYLLLDFDHILTEPGGDFVNEAARAAFEGVLEVMAPTWCELSQSGTGFHIAGIPSPEIWGTMAAGESNTLFFTEDHGAGSSKCEIFYKKNGGQNVVWTGIPYQCRAGQELATGPKANAGLRFILGKIKAQQEKPEENGPRAAAAYGPDEVPDLSRLTGPEDIPRAKAMLDMIDPAQVTRADWITVGMVLKTVGLEVDSWEDWSRKDSARFHEGECVRLWDGFHKEGKNGQMVSMGSLHTLAKRFGYSEYDYQHRNDKKNTEPPVVRPGSDDFSQYIAGGGFSTDIQDFARDGNIKTGFTNLDGASEGGFCFGLYILGGLSGLGKTTFAWQMARQMAAGGRTVIFFSLEMSKLELAAKGIASFNAARSGPEQVTFSRDIKRGRVSADEATAFATALGGRLHVIEGVYRITHIISYIERFIKETGVRPVVVVDYLQVVQTDAGRSRREELDSVSFLLKQCSRAHKILIFTLSSINRLSYHTKIDMEALKESGGLEFTADCVLGMTLSILDNDNATKKMISDAALDIPRKITINALKNRDGGRYFARFRYWPGCDFFEPDPDEYQHEFQDGPLMPAGKVKPKPPVKWTRLPL